MTLSRFVIERDVPGVGLNDAAGFCALAKVSNDALRRLGKRIQWEHSYVTGNKIYCVYLAEDEQVVREHARIAGFPANVITPVVTILDPTSER
jgi:Protein of unknown function (DUF4242)